VGLEPELPNCHDPAMSQSSGRGSQAGGAILALSILSGAIAGIIVGQPSAGLLAGAVIGILVAVAIWLRGRHG
jgi:hypothetical protein